VLNLFKVSQFTPLVLAAKDVFVQAEDMASILRYCAVISVRFNGVGRRSTHILEEVYNRVALDIRRGAIASLAQVRISLRQIYVPDDEFEADFAALRLKNRSISGKRLRYFLAKIEHQLSGVDIDDEVMNASVEHILPENPAQIGWEHFSAEAHERCFERIGNYSLLERNLNGQCASNLPFVEKQRVYALSQYKTSCELGEFSEWTEESISRRQSAMARVAKTVWALSF
jgi:hypothetical protein